MAHFVVTIELLNTPHDGGARRLLDSNLHAAMKAIGYILDASGPRATYFNANEPETDTVKVMRKIREEVRSVHTWSEGKVTRGESSGWADRGYSRGRSFTDVRAHPLHVRGCHGSRRVR